MRIKSPFNDYYDGCLRLDNEPTPLYIRRTSSREIDYSGIYSLYYLNRAISKVDEICYPFIIGIGDFVRFGIRVEGLNSRHYLYSLEETIDYFRVRKIDSSTVTKCSGYSLSDGCFKYTVKSIFEAKYVSMATREAPIWLVTKELGIRKSGNAVLYLNPKLLSYDFARILPPYQTYQVLRTYLDNLAAPIEDIPKISDSDMLEAKGFNSSSFKREKGEGPARKRRKFNRKNKDNR